MFCFVIFFVALERETPTARKTRDYADTLSNIGSGVMGGGWVGRIKSVCGPNIKSRGARGLASKGGGDFTLNIYSMYGTQGTLVSSPHVSTGTLTDPCV